MLTPMRTTRSELALKLTLISQQVYEVETASWQGALTILPVFLDHVLHPLLTDAAFLTEVYHITGSGKKQGVVYCEMAGREDGEEDIVDAEVRAAMFGRGTGAENLLTYAYDCGGRTEKISSELTNLLVREYHRKFYTPGNLTVIVAGHVDEDSLLATMGAALVGEKSSPMSLVMEPPASLTATLHRTVRFPCQDEDFGSICFAWRGPVLEDVYTLAALDVLYVFKSNHQPVLIDPRRMDHLTNNSSSPLQQLFVPVGCDVSYDVKTYAQTCFTITLDGVPTSSSDDASVETVSVESFDDEAEEETEGGGYLQGDQMERTLFDYFKGLHDELQASDAMQQLSESIERGHRALLEEAEESAMDIVTESVITDVLSATFVGGASVTAHVGSDLASRRDTLNRLQRESSDFWRSLLNKYILCAVVVIVKAIPDGSLAISKAEKVRLEEETFCSSLSSEERLVLETSAETARQKNTVSLPVDLLLTMPNLYEIDLRDGLPKCHSSWMELQGSQFAAAHVVTVESNFASVALHLNISALPKRLHPYLLLFQELLFDSPLEGLPSQGDSRPSSNRIDDYRLLVKNIHEDMISFSADAGGQGSALSNLMQLKARCIPNNIETTIHWLLAIIFRTKFDKESVARVSEKLLMRIKEAHRDGSEVLNAAVDALAVAHDAKMHAKKDDDDALMFSRYIDGTTNIVHQVVFLKQLRHGLQKSKTWALIGDRLEDLRRSILKVSANKYTFCSFVLPTSMEVRRKECVEYLAKTWNLELQHKKLDHVQYSILEPTASCPLSIPYPIPSRRLPSQQLAYGVKGLDTGCFLHYVPCHVRDSRERMCVILLCQLLSQGDGPLYSAVRGRGLAYDVRVEYCRWPYEIQAFESRPGTICLSLSESISPSDAIKACYHYIYSLMQPEARLGAFSSAALATAKSSLMYMCRSKRSTGYACAASCMSAVFQVREDHEQFFDALKGFSHLDDQIEVEQSIKHITQDDLVSTFMKYFPTFLAPTE